MLTLDQIRKIRELRNREQFFLEVIDTCEASLKVVEAANKVVSEQAEDDGLWFEAQYALEAYLQNALRRLHAIIEAQPFQEPEVKS